MASSSTNLKLKSSSNVDNKNIPGLVYFLPGIDGHSFCFNEIISAIEKKLRRLKLNLGLINVDIGLYDDFRFQTSENADMKLSEIINQLTTQILTLANTSDYEKDSPIILVGYSFGSLLALSIAQNLTEENKNVSLLIIDAPAPEATKEYYRANNKTATRVLIQMMNLAAKLAGVGQIHENEMETIISKISAWPFCNDTSDGRLSLDENQLGYMLKRIRSSIPDTDPKYELLSRQSNLIASNIKESCNFISRTDICLHKIILFSNPLLAPKFSVTRDCGWLKYTKEVRGIEFTEDHCDHFSILSASYATVIAKELLLELSASNLFLRNKLNMTENSRALGPSLFHPTHKQPDTSAENNTEETPLPISSLPSTGR